jgi:hypothetical protein
VKSKSELLVGVKQNVTQKCASVSQKCATDATVEVILESSRRVF